jgi:hypothetical protein
MGKRGHWFVGATILGGLALSVSTAQAYVRIVSDSGVPLWWRNPCITMEIYLGSPPPTMTAEQYFNASQLAAQAWSHGSLACTGLTLSIRRQPEATADVGLDRKNVIVFLKDSWCKDSNATDGPCYPANALAVTSDFKNDTTGEIGDADIELNAVNISWADLLANPQLTASGTADFQNTLTHELGHVIGLAHPCYSSKDGTPVLKDNNGNDEVTCGKANMPLSVTESTMYPSIPMSDTERRTLSPDDQQAVCDIYPYGSATCGEYLLNGGCALAGQTSSPSSRAWVLGLLAAAVGLLIAVAYRRPRLRTAPCHATRR